MVLEAGPGEEGFPPVILSALAPLCFLSASWSYIYPRRVRNRRRASAYVPPPAEGDLPGDRNSAAAGKALLGALTLPHLPTASSRLLQGFGIGGL